MSPYDGSLDQPRTGFASRAGDPVSPGSDASTPPLHGASAAPASRPERATLGLSVPRVAGGALAAAAAAVASSALGVAGTVLGAILASLVISIGTAVFAHPIERTSQVVRETIPARGDRPERAPSPVVGQSPPARRPERAPFGSWKRVALGAVAMIALTFALLTGMEQLTGKPVSAWTGHGADSGTTLGRLFGAGSSSPGTGLRPPGSQGSHGPQPGAPTGQSTPNPQPTTAAPTDAAPSTSPSAPPTTSPAPSTPPATTAPTSPQPTLPTTPTGAPKATPTQSPVAG